MRIVCFYHSLVLDWNHGNAHFLRGVVTELMARGHEVKVYEPSNGWSLKNLLQMHGREPLDGFKRAYPGLISNHYDLDTLDLDEALEGVDLVLVHEWNDHDLVRRIGRHRARAGPYRLLFHDTHHRAVTQRDSMAAYDLTHYDGVLAFGKVLRDLYLSEKWTQKAWVWHEAADIRVFHPVSGIKPEGDLVWIGNWGDDERTQELDEFLLTPVKRLGLKARVYGVRYPDSALRALEAAGIHYGGWLPNFEVPAVFAQFKLTVHVTRRPYTRALPGIPTIRPFEALACGIPLISAPWEDTEGLFEPGKDFLIARDGREMERHISWLIANPTAAAQMADRGRRTIFRRHTCAHRVDQLMEIFDDLTQDEEGSKILEKRT